MLLKYRKIHDICQEVCQGSGPVPDLFFESHKMDTHLRSKDYCDFLTIFVHRLCKDHPYDHGLEELIGTFLQVWPNITSFRITPSLRADSKLPKTIHLLKLSMWGYCVDLSIVRDIEAVKTVNSSLPTSLESISGLSKRLILNNIKEASKYLLKNKGKRLDIILDNSGGNRE